MHSPEVVVFDLSIPIPTVRWRRLPSQQQWAFERRRYECPEEESPLCGTPIRPWWRPVSWLLALAGREVGWTAVADVWHVEPDGQDAGTVCTGMGGTELTWANVEWAWAHRQHLDIRWLHWQRARNWLFLRCARCGQPFRGANRARIGSWHGDEVRHRDCDLIESQQRQLRLLAGWIVDGEDEVGARICAERCVGDATPFAGTVEDRGRRI